jgi:hypothetical protein
MGLLDDALSWIDARKRYVANTAQDIYNDPGQGLGLLGTRIGDTIKQGAANQLNASDQYFSVIGDKGQALNTISSGLLGGGGINSIYKYAPMYRPPTATNMPSGIVSIDGPNASGKFGTVSYDRPLTSKELQQFELTPLDQNHPANIKKDWEAFHQKFLNDFSESGVYEVPGKGVVTESARPEAPFQFTYIKNGTPQGHESFDDFDELSKFVWGMKR